MNLKVRQASRLPSAKSGPERARRDACPVLRPGTTAPRSVQGSEAGAGFTRVDLLTVIGVLAVLGLLLTPALARTRLADQAFQCRANLGRLLSAWRMYAEDNSDRIPAAYDQYSAVAPAPGWITNSLMSWFGNAAQDGRNSCNWDTEVTVKQSPLWNYCGNDEGIWRCPSDGIFRCVPASGPLQGRSLPRVRSYSMSSCFNSRNWTSWNGPGFTTYTKVGECLKPGPAKTFVFLHERVDSINDGEFAVAMDGYPNSPLAFRILDYPASQHDGACGFAFVDGHSEMKKWLDPRTKPPVGPRLQLNVRMPNNVDVYWLMDHSTRRS